jgi:hypothetical protein
MGNIEEVRGRILDGILRVIVLVGALAYIPSVCLSVASGLWVIVAADTIAYAVFIAAAVSRRADFRLKLAAIVSAGIVIAGIVLFYTGPYGAGYIWLICAIFLAALLGSARLIAATVLASAAILGGFALLIAVGAAPHGQPLVTFAITAANLIFVCVLLSIAARNLIKGMESAYGEERRLAVRVGEELEAARAADAALHAEMEIKETLMKELHHRVHNNMQIVLSLLDIEDKRRDEGSISRIARRVLALSFADDLVLSDPSAETVDLDRLVSGFVNARRADASMEEGFTTGRLAMRLPIASVVTFSVIIAEVLDALAELRRPVAVALEGERGAESLSFRWPSGESGELIELVARLRSDPVIEGLADHCVLSCGTGDGGRESALFLDLARV